MFNNDVKDDFIMEQQVQKTCVPWFPQAWIKDDTHNELMYDIGV